MNPDTGDEITRLTTLAGRYRVERELGAGGMATVYLADDLKHDRKVALKVLKPELAAVIGAQRFLTEIKTTANLQHAHILSLFDSGEVDGTVFYVMPFVDGESLRDRLNRERQLPVADAVRIAREVADALQYAHDRGVIHRDVKPENILLQGGHALVADFGIALAASKTSGNRLTETGMSLGTPTYMSPEQAMGERTLDARTDIYALGCVLYEMLVGEPPFTGPTAQSIVARVMTEEPRSITAQRKTVPAHVAGAVEVALSKLPADRFASAAEFSSALGGDTGTVARPSSSATAARRPSGPRTLVAMLAGALVLATAAATWSWLRRPPAESVSRSYVKFPDAEAPVPGRNTYALLPDGSALVYVGKGSSGTQLWTKKRTELHATQLGGTAGASNVFVSPDGNWIGFIADGKLKKIPSAGGEATTLADASCGSLACAGSEESGAWLENGRIAFVSQAVLLTVSENGGRVDTVVKTPDIRGLAPLRPVGLPGARGLLFTACTLYCNKSTLMVVNLATRQARTLVEDARAPQYLSTGHLVYVDGQGTAFAVPFDLETLTTHGTPTPVLERVGGTLAISRTGTLVYAEGDAQPRSELVITSRDGRSIQPIDTTWRGNFASLALSPDGKRIAASVFTAGQENLWIKAISGGPPTRLTFGNVQSTTPTWSADGSSVFFTRFEGTRSSAFMEKRADGTGPEVTVKSGDDWVIESATSRDGEWLVLREYRSGARDIYVRRMHGDTTERAIVANPGQDYSPAISPNGKWLAYASDESATTDVWVVPFPNPQGAKWQISTSGGIEPTWSPDGQELFYVNNNNELVAVSVSAETAFSAGNQRILFSLAGYRRHLTHRAYDVMPDGQHFLMIKSGTPTTGDFVVVDHWMSELFGRLK